MIPGSARQPASRTASTTTAATRQQQTPQNVKHIYRVNAPPFAAACFPHAFIAGSSVASDEAVWHISSEEPSFERASTDTGGEEGAPSHASYEDYPPDADDFVVGPTGPAQALPESSSLGPAEPCTGNPAGPGDALAQGPREDAHPAQPENENAVTQPGGEERPEPSGSPQSLGPNALTPGPDQQRTSASPDQHVPPVGPDETPTAA